jgi:hypothetical protein
VDSLRVWAFGTSWIACVTHEAVKQSLEVESPTHVDWTVYNIPKELLGYDPVQYVASGLYDLSACDDGSLTAIMEHKRPTAIMPAAFMGGTIGAIAQIVEDLRVLPVERRIFTAATQFGKGLPIIKPGENLIRGTGAYIPTHGWRQDPQESTDAHRVHKLPIFCWPMIEALESTLTAG